MAKEAGDLPSSRERSGGVEPKQKEDMPEKPKKSQNSGNHSYWLLDETDTLWEIYKRQRTKLRAGILSGSHFWISIIEEFNSRFEGRLQEKGALKKDGKNKLAEDRYAPRRNLKSIQTLFENDTRLKRILKEYKELEKETDSGKVEETDSRKRKRQIEETNAAAAHALSAKKSRLSSFDDGQ
ncbi:hypothetical protein EAE96_011088 [Botrytis aclada]|nr:hypothetical protein EAE96_011088 [Botrytis aclada]